MNRQTKGPLQGFQHTPAIAQPAILNNWLVWFLLAAAFLIPFFLPIAQSLRRHPIIGALGEQLHIPLLACITLLIYWKGPLRGRLWYAAGAGAIIGGLIEFVQILVGRSALFADWLLDLVGIGLVVGFVLWKGQANKYGKWLLLALLLYIPAQLWELPFKTLAKYEARMTFPVIADFDGDHFQWLWSDNFNAELEMAPCDSVRGQTLKLISGPPSRWPGARMTNFPHDWSSFSELVFEVRVSEAAADSLRFGVRLDDWQGRQDKVWAQKGFYATREWQTFTFPIVDRKVLRGERLLDLNDLEAMIFFVPIPVDSFALEIDNIRLQ